MGSLSARGNRATPIDWKFYSGISLFVTASIIVYGMIIWLVLSGPAK